ncbi:MAG: hypothetical protein Q9217_002089 [Psora testacea]
MDLSERQAYGRMGDTMSYYHNHFKSTWNVLYGACESNRRPANMSIKQFLNTTSQFLHHLEIHHSIEEQHIFPVLAQRMPAFKEEMALLSQHKQIHAGMDKLEAYVEECKSSKRDFRLDEMKKVLDSFGTVLWTHLDEEVQNLSPENMQKYWSVDEGIQFAFCTFRSAGVVALVIGGHPLSGRPHNRSVTMVPLWDLTVWTLPHGFTGATGWKIVVGSNTMKNSRRILDYIRVGLEASDINWNPVWDLHGGVYLDCIRGSLIERRPSDDRANGKPTEGITNSGVAFCTTSVDLNLERDILSYPGTDYVLISLWAQVAAGGKIENLQLLSTAVVQSGSRDVDRLPTPTYRPRPSAF